VTALFEPPLRRDDPGAVELHDVLIRAYDDEVEALAIAGQVGLLKADIERYPRLRDTWWSILEEAALERQLERLVTTAAKDPTIAAYRPRLQALLDQPDAAPAVSAPQSADEQRERQLHPEVGATARLWEPGQTLHARFLGGPASVRSAVEARVESWLEYANLEVSFGKARHAEIRIGFGQPGSWSFLGTDCLSVPPGEPTINFGWLDRNTPKAEVDRVVLHEFGHVLGLQHETGNPASTIEWDRPRVYQDLAGPPNHWSRETVDTVFFAIWPPGYFPVHKVFDPDSIMMVPGEAKHVRSGKPPAWNLRLSALDKQFAAALYPQRARP
jgi:hypothetical protein